ncbi:MAG: hypothetical protein ABIS50_10570 [Luteolibacter sp.]|uniref:hypothetical protein n=1 Tax=Luteolibacter sp. TaxID=1962973 RepID=UPI003262D3C0
MNAPFHLDQAIARWRTELNESGSIGTSDLAELESHLRDAFDELRMQALTEDEAFHLARRRLGGAEMIEEFAKIDPDAVWAERARWMIFGVLVSQVFWNGTRMFTTFAAIVAAMSTRSLGWSDLVCTCAYYMVSFMAMGLFVWVVLRLVRGNWRLGNSRKVSFFLNPAVLAGMICLTSFLNSMANIFMVRSLGVGVYAGQNQIWAYIGFGMLTAIPVILAAALRAAQRRACAGS